MSKKRVLEFNFGKLFDLIEDLEDQKEVAAKEAIENASKIVQKDLDAFFDSHTNTGQADEALIQNPQFTYVGERIEMKLGFDKNKPHGFLAYYFEHGTPKNNPPQYKFINTAFRQSKVRTEMRKTLKKYMQNSGK